MNTQPHHPLRTPRDYAAAILAEVDRSAREAILARCPPEWRDQVETHVRDAWEKRQAYLRHRREGRAAAQQKPPAAPRQNVLNSVIHPTRSAPEVGNAHLAALRALCTRGPE